METVSNCHRKPRNTLFDHRSKHSQSTTVFHVVTSATVTRRLYYLRHFCVAVSFKSHRTCSVWQDFIDHCIIVPVTRMYHSLTDYTMKGVLCGNKSSSITNEAVKTKVKRPDWHLHGSCMSEETSTVRRYH